jgi:hypothetical protein
MKREAKRHKILNDIIYDVIIDINNIDFIFVIYCLFFGCVWVS